MTKHTNEYAYVFIESDPKHEEAIYKAWMEKRPHSIITQGKKFWTWGLAESNLRYSLGPLCQDWCPSGYPWMPSNGERNIIRAGSIWITKRQCVDTPC